MWFIYALFFAIASSITFLAAKKILKEIDEYLYFWLIGIFTLVPLFLIIVYFYQIPKFDEIFIKSMLISSLLDVIAALYILRAIKISDISLISPISAFNPVFTAILSLFILGEVISVRGWFGIGLVCVGAYLLEFSKSKKKLLTPIKNFLSNRGIQLSLVAYFLWSITPIFQKTAILHTSPQVPPFASLSGLIITNLAFGLMTVKFSHSSVQVVKKYLFLIAFLGILGSVAQTSAFMAFSLTNLGFATSIFKLSIIFSVILGGMFFRERSIKERLLGSLIMLIGVLLIVT